MSATAATAPPRPANVSADGQVTSSTSASVTISWTRPPGAASVSVLRNTSSDSTSGATAVLTKSTALSYTDKTITPGSTAYYFVKSYDSAGKASAAVPLAVTAANDAASYALSADVTDVNGTRLPGATVQAYRGSYTSAFLVGDNNGVYSTTYLPYAANGLAVCFSDSYDGATGYVAFCWKSSPYLDPKDAPRLGFAKGEFRALNVQMMGAAAVKVKITDNKGKAVVDANAYAWDADGDQVASSAADSDGVITLGGLAPGAYTVSFDGSFSSTSSHKYGFVPQFLGGAALYSYDPGDELPASGVTNVTAVSGSVTDAGTVKLTAGGRLQAAINDTASNASASVELLDGDGNNVVSRFYGTYFSNGTTNLVGVPAGSYSLCVYDYGDNVYQSACWAPGGSVPWDGSAGDVPTAAQGKFKITADKSVKATVRLGVYSHVTGTVSGVSGANVDLVDATGNYIDSAGVQNDGDSFSLRGLPGNYSVCTDYYDSSTKVYSGYCWNGATGKQEAWDGDSSRIPSDVVGTVKLTSADYTGVNFVFPATSSTRKK